MILDSNGREWRRKVGFERRLERVSGSATIDLISGKEVRVADDWEDWDACIEEAPKRPSGTLEVTLKYGGRGRPRAVDFDEG